MTPRPNPTSRSPAEPEPGRRALLAAAASLLPGALAGCQTSVVREQSSGLAAKAATARLEMDDAADSELPAKVLYSIGATQPGDPKAKLLDTILDSGATTDATRPPLPTGQHIAYDDGVFELSSEVVEKTPATRYSVKVDIVQETIREEEAIQFGDLPAVDRGVFADKGLADGEVVGIGTTLLYTDAQREKSVLVPESEYSYITWEDGAEAEWVVDDAGETTLNSYRYSAEQVATAKEYGQRMRDSVAFEFSDLSADQRDIVETAIEDEQYVVGPDETPPEPLVDLADDFRGEEQAHGLDETGEQDLSGPYIVRYDGTVYWTTFVVNSEAFATTTPS